MAITVENIGTDVIKDSYSYEDRFKTVRNLYRLIPAHFYKPKKPHKKVIKDLLYLAAEDDSARELLQKFFGENNINALLSLDVALDLVREDLGLCLACCCVGFKEDIVQFLSKDRSVGLHKSCLKDIKKFRKVNALATILHGEVSKDKLLSDFSSMVSHNVTRYLETRSPFFLGHCMLCRSVIPIGISAYIGHPSITDYVYGPPSLVCESCYEYVVNGYELNPIEVKGWTYVLVPVIDNEGDSIVTPTLYSPLTSSRSVNSNSDLKAVICVDKDRWNDEFIKPEDIVDKDIYEEICNVAEVAKGVVNTIYPIDGKHRTLKVVGNRVREHMKTAGKDFINCTTIELKDGDRIIGRLVLLIDTNEGLKTLPVRLCKDE